MNHLKNTCFLFLFSFVLLLSSNGALQAIGTYEDGWMLAKKLTKFESGGLLFESWEGEITVDSIEKKEECNEKKYECFTPKEQQIKFSVSLENGAAINFLRNKKDRGSFLIHFRVHRIEAAKLKEDFEIIEAKDFETSPPGNFPSKKISRKTGSRNFSLYGRVVRLSDQGTMISTYEGLYLDMKRNKIHPFSVTDEEMAEHVIKAMQYEKPFYIGISVAITTGFRKSDHDVFEINYTEEAGGVEIEKKNP